MGQMFVYDFIRYAYHSESEMKHRAFPHCYLTYEQLENLDQSIFMYKN
jgi:hypothetical protein